jgi:pimeloyl-ACP methyl ester carboxylesterase
MSTLAPAAASALTPDRFLPTPDGRLAVVDRGEGPTVVFVHGTPSGSHEFADVVAALPDHRCVAAAMDALDVHDAVFVLTDFGTAFALPWLLEHPGRVRGVVLSNTFLWRARGPMAWLLAWYATAPGRWMYRAFNLSARYLLPFAWGRKRPLTPERHAAYLAPFARPVDRYATAALPGELISRRMDALEARAGELARFPIEAVWGMADAMVGPGELQRWKGLLPDLVVHEVEDAGHFVADEAPEAVAMAVRRRTRQAAAA